MMLSGLLTHFLLAVVGVWMTTKVKAWWRRVRILDKIDGPKIHPVLGNLLDVLVPPEDLLNVIVGFCPITRSMSRIWLTRLFPYVLVHKAAAVEAVLSSQKIITKSPDYDFLMPWLGTGLLTSTGSKWSGRRKMLTPAFHFRILEDFVEVFNNKAQVLVERLTPKVGGEVFDIFNIVAFCTLDIIIETAMGLNLDVQNNSDAPYVTAVQRISGIIQERQKTPWLHPNFLFRFSSYAKEHDQHISLLHDVSLSTIRERREAYRKDKLAKADRQDAVIEGKKKRVPFLDLLLQYSEDTEGFTDEDIREEVDTFMFEGHDTTATAINMTLYLLGRNSSIQKLVHEELDRVLGPSDSGISSEQLKKLKYLECCIKEALRLYPSVPIFGRRAPQDFSIEGKAVPAGAAVLVISYQLHRDPDQFPDPDRFNPDRFLPENSVGRHPYAYVPFSAGPRNCIGQKFALMEEKVVLATLLRKFRVESMDPIQDLKIMAEIILRPKDGIRVKLWNRD